MITVDYINQGKYDYLGAEISINNQIVCLIAINNSLGLEIKFHHESRELDKFEKLTSDFDSFMNVVRECEIELRSVISVIKQDT